MWSFAKTDSRGVLLKQDPRENTNNRRLEKDQEVKASVGCIARLYSTHTPKEIRIAEIRDVSLSSAFMSHIIDSGKPQSNRYT